MYIRQMNKYINKLVKYWNFGIFGSERVRQFSETFGSENFGNSEIFNQFQFQSNLLRNFRIGKFRNRITFGSEKVWKFSVRNRMELEFPIQVAALGLTKAEGGVGF